MQSSSRCFFYPYRYIFLFHLTDTSSVLREILKINFDSSKSSLIILSGIFIRCSELACLYVISTFFKLFFLDFALNFYSIFKLTYLIWSLFTFPRKNQTKRNLSFVSFTIFFVMCLSFPFSFFLSSNLKIS